MDVVVLEALLDALVPEDRPPIAWVQPPQDPTELGVRGGWKGVRAWLQDVVGGFGGLSDWFAEGPGRNTDVLVVHVDADVASDDEMDCERPCPPATATINELRESVLRWAGEVEAPARLVLWIPSKSTDAWVYAALYAETDRRKHITMQLECRKEPAALLCPQPDGLVRKHGKRYRKDEDAHKRVSPRLTSGWPSILRFCPEAATLFETELRAALQGSAQP